MGKSRPDRNDQEGDCLNQDANRDLRSYGRRRGRKPSERQAHLLRELLPRVAVDLAALRLAPSGRLAAERSHGLAAGSPEASCQRQQTWLEIGFGGGEHLLWQARRNPHVAFIGCEPFEDGVVKVLTAIDDEKLTNIRVHMDDARDLLRALPEDVISRAFVLFPDPWPKRKHQKRRLISVATLGLLSRAIAPGAELRIATDIGDYARSALEAIRDEGSFVWRANRPADWRERPDDWPETRYETKAAAAGRKRYYFSFFRA